MKILVMVVIDKGASTMRPNVTINSTGPARWSNWRGILASQRSNLGSVSGPVAMV